MAHGIMEQPGSIVRVRSAAVPSPEWKGYAKAVAESRGGVVAGPAPDQDDTTLPADRGLDDVAKQQATDPPAN